MFIDSRKQNTNAGLPKPQGLEGQFPAARNTSQTKKQAKVVKKKWRNLDNFLDNFQGTEYLPSLDSHSGYYYVLVRETDKEKKPLYSLPTVFMN